MEKLNHCISSEYFQEAQLNQFALNVLVQNLTEHYRCPLLKDNDRNLLKLNKNKHMHNDQKNA